MSPLPYPLILLQAHEPDRRLRLEVLLGLEISQCLQVPIPLQPSHRPVLGPTNDTATEIRTSCRPL